MIKLTALELENFQTIERHTVVPIRNLTLMFGPNGAGKSSIYDALDLLKIIFSEDWGVKSKKLSDLLERWATNKQVNKSLGVGLQFYVDKNWDLKGMYNLFNLDDLYKIHTASIQDNYKNEFCNQTFRVFIEFSKAQGDYHWIISNLNISNGTKQILSLDTKLPKDNLTCNRVQVFRQDWIDFDAIDKSLDIKKGKIDNIEYFELFYGRYLDEIDTRKWFADTSLCQIERYLKDRDAHNAAEEIVCQIIDFFKILINNSMDWGSNELIGLIPGSRTVPSPSELIFLISGSTWLNGSPGKRKIIPPQIISHQSILIETRNRLNPELTEWEKIAANYAKDKCAEPSDNLKDYWDKNSITTKINSLLSEELFLEQGYQISGEVKCLVNIEELIEFNTSESITYPKLVNLFLIGPNGKRVEIDDVGSGIGYVLPVLSSLAATGISLIQQPELHLHPALQSALGTAIVKCVENKKDYNAFTLIETHSEHILLRIMRLLKNAKARDEEVIIPIDFENVAILYFQPKGDGTTIIKRLRLGPDGQLVDRWPGGFFEERYKDIFDA
jgi:AAA15 family ATPase/GTPase